VKTRVLLQTPSAKSSREFLAAVRRSRRLHAPWVSPPATPRAYREYLRRRQRSTHVGYFVRLREGGHLVGVVNVSEIVHGSFRSAYLGYYAFTPYARHGFMTEGLSLVIDDAFRRLRLHRLEANIQPGNIASIRLVRRLGFRREGFSPRYLRVNGKWRDHERWAMLAERWKTRARRGARPR
jgi:[ribosomal protein S5]-alanine N-acetyltransferase